MRHSDINLTMGSYTDPKLLEVRQAVERLPSFAPQRVYPRPPARESAHDCARADGLEGLFLAPTDTIGAMTGRLSEERSMCENAGNVNEKPPVTSPVTGGREVERRRFELLTSSLRTKRSTS